jgi:succinyl-CoA synthetase alpha subunit
LVSELTKRGIGQSTSVGIGGDPIVGSSFVEILALFEKDPETRVVALIGEIGGTDEEEAAEFIVREFTKPVVAFVAGKTAPAGKRMGHAGAIVSGGYGTAAEKIKALEEAGVAVGRTPEDMVEAIVALIRGSAEVRAKESVDFHSGAE